MKTNTALRNLVQLILIIITLCFSSCKNENPLVPNNENDFEKILESKIVDVTPEGMEIALGDGSTVTFPKSAVNTNTRVTIKRIQNDYLYFGENRVFIDVKPEKEIKEFRIAIKIPAGLKKDETALMRYAPGVSNSDSTAEFPEFDYDSNLGYIICRIANKAQKQKDEIQINSYKSRFIAEWSQNKEPKNVKKIIQMPFYEQPGKSCWAACAVMLTKAYTPYLSREREYEVYHFLKRLQVERDDGLGYYVFLRKLHPILHDYTGNGFETCNFFWKNSLKPKIIEEIDKNHPILVRMDYPGVGPHAILIVGYQKKNDSLYLIYHNPQAGINEDYRQFEGMYVTHNFDWVFKKHWELESCSAQFLYPTDEPHPQRTNLTISLPLITAGVLQFLVPSGHSYRIDFNYDLNSPNGYKWQNASGRDFVSIPDSASELILRLPIFNSDLTNEKKAKVNIMIWKTGGEKVYEYSENLTIPVSDQPVDFSKTIPVKNIVGNNDSCEYYIKVSLYENDSQYDDGFDFKVSINSRMKILSILPEPANVGDIVTIKGIRFGNPKPKNSSITFNGIQVLSYYDWNDSLIRCTVPQNATSGDVIVNINGKTSNRYYFTIGTMTEKEYKIEVDTTINYSTTITPIYETMKQVPLKFTLNYKINGSINGLNICTNYGNYNSNLKSWTFDNKVPGKINYDINISCNYLSGEQYLEWEDKYQGKECIMKGDFKIKEITDFKPVESFNNIKNNDLMKHIPFSHSSTVISYNESKFLLTADIPALNDINKIISDNNINPLLKYLSANLVLRIPFQLNLNIFDKATNQLIKSETLDVTTLDVGADLIFNFK